MGVVVICNKRKYLIPLSHPVEKHKKMKPRADFDKIIDKRGKGIPLALLIFILIGVAGITSILKKRA